MPPPRPMPANVPLEGKPWSRGRRLSTVLLLFWLQVTLLWFYGDRPPPDLPPAIFQTHIQWAMDLPADDATEVWPWLPDPAVLSLPSRHGFSGPAWLRFPRLRHELVDWTDAAQWLPLEGSHLGATLRQVVARETIPPPRLADQPIPALAIDAVAMANPLPPDRSRLQIQGELRGRSLLSPWTLPGWTHAEILTNTLVQVAVQEDGTVFSAVLLRSCGLEQADAFALAQSRAARFQPAPPASRGEADPATEPLVFGTLLFLWHTRPLAPAPSSTPAQTGS